MSLCRYLPVPSDRMAVMWTLLTVGDAVVLEYGPAGTTHYCVSLFGAMGISPDQSLFTTHMSEDDVIMGDVRRLEEAIVELDKGYRPKVIFVIASAVTAVIGTDLVGVCNYMQQQVDARLIALENGGFKGDYTVGLRQVYRLLVKQLAGQKQGLLPGRYNVLGASASSYRIRSDLREIEDLLSRSFGLSRHTALGVDTSLQQLAAMGGAQLNIVLRAEALPAAEWLKQQFGTPYVYGVPYGYQGTEQWLEQIASVLERPIARSVRDQLGQRQSQTAAFRMYATMYRNRPHPPAAAIIGDYDLLQGLAGLCRELDICPDLLICPHTLKDITDCDPIVRHFATEKEQITALRQLQYHLVLGDDVSLYLCDRTNTGLCVSFPLVSHVQIAEHLPLMGIRGTDYILETIDRYYQVLE